MTHKHPPAVALACFAVLGCVALVQAVTLEVTEGNSTCIKAELSALFSITYSTANGTSTVSVALPASAAVGSGSSCGGGGRTPWLEASFGDGHSLGLGFSSDGSQYSVVNLTLQYNLSDSTTFPQSSSAETVTLATNSSGISARVNTTYRCLSDRSMRLDDGVTLTFSDVRLEAYMPGANLSVDESICTADQGATTVVPTTTTVVPTNTTAAPAPTPAPSPTGNPDQGNYNVTKGNGTVCLLARMGLQLNVTYFSTSQNKTVQGIVNLPPNRTSSSGLCEATSATLLLTEDRTNLSFTFTLNSTTNKYHLSGLSLSAAWPDMTAPFSASNSSLDYLRGTLGRSYMCSAMETLTVATTLSLNTFLLRVQPFGVSGDQFGTAEECQVDQDNMLIPIVVGVALAGLVLIVLIAYLIGRKRSHAGYQTI